MPVTEYRMAAVSIVYKDGFSLYDSKNGGNAPPQKSITARASCCSDRDCDFAHENELDTSIISVGYGWGIKKLFYNLFCLRKVFVSYIVLYPFKH